MTGPTPPPDAPSGRSGAHGEPLVRDTDLEAAQALGPARGRGGGRRIPAWWWGALATLVAWSWWMVLVRPGKAVVPPDVLGKIADFVGRLAGAEASRPAFVEGPLWSMAAGLAADTVAMSVIGAGLAAAGALATLAFASRPLATGDFALARPAVGRVLFGAVRGLYVVTRAIPDYLWALLIVLVLDKGLFAGAVALALHNLGVLGRLGAEVAEDLDAGPLRALRSSGAGNVQILAYGVLPQVLPQLLTFLLYRWEVMIRSSAVVGFVTTAGIGYELQSALIRFDYTLVALLLAVYVLVVLGVDLISGGLRRLAR